MPRVGVDDEVLRIVRDGGRAMRFSEIADKLSGAGISRSQVHNAVYRLGKRGRLLRLGTRGAMSYAVNDG